MGTIDGTFKVHIKVFNIHVFLYAEKIYQRQIMKQGLSNSVVDDEANSKRHFKSEDLKNIFSLNMV